jgi:hypothetical protein
MIQSGLNMIILLLIFKAINVPNSNPLIYIY